MEIVEDYLLPWLMSALTLYMTFLQGNKNPVGWLVGLFNQILWLLFICITETWGLLPLNLGLWYLYIRNWLKWRDLWDARIAVVRPEK